MRFPGWNFRKFLQVVGLACFLGMTAFQAWAYYFRLELSLGPRVILQPWLLQRGYLMYENLGDIHTPLMPLSISALLPLIPDGLRLAKLVLVGLLTLTTCLIFFTVHRRQGIWWGAWAVFFFVTWSPTFEFTKLWHESILTPLYLLWMFIDQDSGHPFQTSIAGEIPKARATAPPELLGKLHRDGYSSLGLLGLLGGVAIMVKQHAVVVFALYLCWKMFLWLHDTHSVGKMLRELFVVLACACIPGVLFLIYQLSTSGTLSGFFFWVYDYQMMGVYRSMAGLLPSQDEVGKLASCFLLILPVIACLVQMKRPKDESWRMLGGGIVLWFAGSITVYPRFGFFHLMGTLAITAAINGMTLATWLKNQNGSRLFSTAMVITLSLVWLLNAGARYLPVWDWNTPRQIREYSSLSVLARDVRNHVQPPEQIFIFPEVEANSNLYYLLQSPPPRYWIFHYPWYMIPPIKDRILVDLLETLPEWVVYFPNQWEAESTAPEVLSFITSRYEEVTRFGSGQRLLRRK